MKKNALANLMLIFSLIALTIAVYQIVDSRILDGILSLVFSTVFLMGGMANRNKRKDGQ